ncbi:threonine synthase [Actinomycetes bacterium NPDC127524]
MNYSFASHLDCPKCHSVFPVDSIHQLCHCGSPLLVKYHLQELKNRLTKDEVRSRKDFSLWRYHELLPVMDENHVVTLGEGFTPLIKMEKIGHCYSIKNLYMKDEGNIPTGSFKARGASVGVSRAKELGVRTLAMPTNGNAGGAWALYSSRAGIEAYVVMPKDAPYITRVEVSIAGAHLYLIDGLISDAGKAVARLVAENKFYDASTLKEPYRIEGKKTMGYEIAEQLNWNLPDVILYPTGGGVGIIGIYKALLELKELGWITGKLPRLVAVQSEGCAPIVKAWQERKKESEFWDKSSTKAFGINVPKALGDFLVLEALYETNGYAISVSEESIQKSQQQAAELEGNFICPEGAATFAAAYELRKRNWIKEDETVVCLNTGQGIKYPDLFSAEPPLLRKGENIVI